jgi:hypothetical protein
MVLTERRNSRDHLLGNDHDRLGGHGHRARHEAEEPLIQPGAAVAAPLA